MNPRQLQSGKGKTPTTKGQAMQGSVSKNADAFMTSNSNSNNSPFTASHMLQLQRTIGNKAVGQFLTGSPSTIQRSEDVVRQSLGEVDLKAGAAAILTSDSQIVTQMKTVLIDSGRLKMAANVDELADLMATDKKIAKQEAADMISNNKGRGFTGSDGTIYVMEGAEAAHDIVHETVHVCSAPGGLTKILQQFGEPLNEGFTEYFTKEFCSMLGVADAPAYPNEVAFVRKLADQFGVASLHQAYLQDGGMDDLIGKITDKWEETALANAQLKIKPGANHAKNLEMVKKKLATLSFDSPVAMNFWNNCIFI
jgi:hypothetical protein